MKTKILLTALLFLISSANVHAATRYYYLDWLPGWKEALAGLHVSSPDQIVTQEGQPSYTYSSARREPDFFLIPPVFFFTRYSGRILQVGPFTTSDSRPSYGIEETNVTLVDVRTKQIFSAPLTNTTLNGAKVHYGTLTIDDRLLFIKAFYTLSPRYPVTQITWGDGADFGKPGLKTDTFQTVYPAELQKPPRITDFRVTERGIIVIGEVPPGQWYWLESSSDLKNWKRESAGLSHDPDYLGNWYLGSGWPGGKFPKENRFFRLSSD